MKDRKKIDPDRRGYGEELGAVEGRETMIRIYYLFSKSILKKGDRIKILKKKKEKSTLISTF